MISMSLYLILDLSAIAIPVAFSFHKRLNFYRYWPALFISILITGLVFISWDHWFVSLGVWGFNPDYINGIYIWNLPLEEYLFFVCVPFACFFTFHVIRTLFPGFSLPAKFQNTSIVLLSVLLFVAGFLNLHRYYTSFSFIAAGISLLLCRQWMPELMPHFILSFAANLIPFALMNGILTGTFLENPVVWYNDEENLGIRILTIPFEDLFYGLTLLLWNTGLTVYFYRRFHNEEV